jgi:hypothetical protein
MASQGNDWLLFSEVPGWLGGAASTAARDIIGRGTVPVSAMRSDIPGGTTPERVEKLLTQARKADVWLGGDAITAYYSGDQDRRSILGPRSSLQSLDVILEWSYADRHRLWVPGFPGVTHDWPYEGGDWAIGLRSCRVHWPPLASALTEAGYRVKNRRPGPHDGEKSPKDLACEIALRILGDKARRPKPGYRRMTTLAQTVNAELAGEGYQYLDDSVRRMIGPTVRDWETRNPQK